jgi:50S ribosome-binding GTPase
MTTRIRHTLIWLLVLLIPCLILIPLGGIWLWEQNWLFYFGGGWLLLVAGQVKAGKSSLINALFGELQAATDVLACTSNIIPYRLERNGTDLALVLDSPGYTAQ